MRYIVTYGGFTLYEGTDMELAYDIYTKNGPYTRIFEVEE